MGVKTIQEINNEISLLITQAENLKGTKTETHTSIVGYYRPLHNWNPGKWQEYKERVMFKPEVIR